MNHYTNINESYMLLLNRVQKCGTELETRNHKVRRRISETIRIDETPLVTVRKTAWKSALLEMEFFMRGGNHLDELAKSVHSWWEYACTVTPNTLHLSYGIAMRRLWAPDMSNIVQVNKKTNPVYVRPVKPVKPEIVTRGPLTGQIKTSNYGIYEVMGVVESTSSRSNSIYQIYFLQTGTIAQYRGDVLQSNNVKDPYCPKIHGVACYGRPNKKHPAYKKARAVWDHMINRCYNPKDSGYLRNMDRGVTVWEGWLVFENFLNDISKLTGYERWFSNTSAFHFDKDYFLSTEYGPSVCVFLPKEMNTLISKTQGCTIVDQTHKFIKKRDYVKFVNKSKGNHAAEFISNTEEVAFRPQITVDQVAYILDCLRNHPNSRRAIMTTWNPEDVQSDWMNPTNCHGSMTQFFVENGKLVMTHYQRSADLLLGIPHNFMQYWALLHYFAFHSGLQVGEIHWTIGDAHIYQDPSHVEVVEELENYYENVLYEKYDPVDSPAMEYNFSGEHDSAGVPVFKASDFSLVGEIPEPIVKSRPKLF